MYDQTIETSGSCEKLGEYMALSKGAYQKLLGLVEMQYSTVLDLALGGPQHVLPHVTVACIFVIHRRWCW